MSEREIDRKRYRLYTLEGDWIVLVGKTDRDNDELSLCFSEPEDYWFHVDGCPGAHVLLLHKKGEKPPNAILEMAARITAWWSKARKAKRVGVGMTRAANVGKRRGSPAGQVTVQRETLIRVAPGLPDHEE